MSIRKYCKISLAAAVTTALALTSIGASADSPGFDLPIHNNTATDYSFYYTAGYLPKGKTQRVIIDQHIKVPKNSTTTVNLHKPNVNFSAATIRDANGKYVPSSLGLCSDLDPELNTRITTPQGPISIVIDGGGSGSQLSCAVKSSK